MQQHERGLTLIEHFQELDVALEQAEGGDETALAILDHYIAAGKDKVDRVAGFIRSFDDDIEACEHAIEMRKQQIVALQQRIGALQKKQQRASDRVLYTMDLLDTKRFCGHVHELVCCKVPDSVNITDVEKIPAEYITVTTKTVSTPNKNEIKKALQSGVNVPGADLAINKVRLAVRVEPIKSRPPSTANNEQQGEQ